MYLTLMIPYLTALLVITALSQPPTGDYSRQAIPTWANYPACTYSLSHPRKDVLVLGCGHWTGIATRLNSGAYLMTWYAVNSGQPAHRTQLTYAGEYWWTGRELIGRFKDSSGGIIEEKYVPVLTVPDRPKPKPQLPERVVGSWEGRLQGSDTIYDVSIFNDFFGDTASIWTNRKTGSIDYVGKLTLEKDHWHEEYILGAGRVNCDPWDWGVGKDENEMIGKDDWTLRRK